MIAEKKEILDEELEMQEEVLIQRAQESDDVKLAEFIIELNVLKIRFRNDIERLQGQVEIAGFVHNMTDITKHRAKLLEEKVALQKEEAKIIDEAESEYLKTVDEATLIDRPLKHLVQDINTCDVCYKECSGDVSSALDVMDRVNQSQQDRKKEFLRVDNIFTYSTAKGCVVWCKGKKRENAWGFKWDFYRYYEPCTRDQAMYYFRASAGTAVAAPTKKSGKESEYTTMFL